MGGGILSHAKQHFHSKKYADLDYYDHIYKNICPSTLLKHSSVDI